MQKWAYLFVTCEVWKGNWHPRWMQGQELPAWKQLALDDFCNQLGDDGWELGSTLLDSTYYRFIFKRPKAPDRY